MYYDGLKLFDKIFERDGFESAKIAANTLVTDKQLRQF
jgi:hypothetical protein